VNRIKSREVSNKVYFGLDNLDEKISKYVDKDYGTFVELGAYDGVTQSNTLFLERSGWRGVLIEPQPEIFKECVRNRPEAKVFQCACISDNDTRNVVELDCVGLMSLVSGYKDDQEEKEWIVRAKNIQDISHKKITVPARTLSAVIEEARLVNIDLLIVDVEGAELSVLQGLDFLRWRPKYIVCEDNYGDHVAQFLEHRQYKILDILSERKYTRDVIYVDGQYAEK